jgi:hypothetical protein
MTDPKPQGPAWKHIAELTLWLALALPVGLWKLYHDDTLSRGTKWRILIYLCVIPTLLYITASVWMTSSALQKVIP